MYIQYWIFPLQDKSSTYVISNCESIILKRTSYFPSVGCLRHLSFCHQITASYCMKAFLTMGGEGRIRRSKGPHGYFWWQHWFPRLRTLTHHFVLIIFESVSLTFLPEIHGHGQPPPAQKDRQTDGRTHTRQSLVPLGLILKQRAKVATPPAGASLQTSPHQNTPLSPIECWAMFRSQDARKPPPRTHWSDIQ